MTAAVVKRIVKYTLVPDNERTEKVMVVSYFVMQLPEEKLVTVDTLIIVQLSLTDCFVVLDAPHNPKTLKICLLNSSTL